MRTQYFGEVARHLGFLLLLFSCLECPTAGAEGEKPLRIAINVPLTGPFGVYGTAIQDGFDFAGIENPELSSSLVTFDWEDNEGSPVKTVSALRNQLRSQPDIYLSGVRPQTMAIWDELARLGLPHFLWIFDISLEHGNAPNFRTLVNFREEAPLFLSYAAERKARRVGIIYVQLPSTDAEYKDVIIPKLKETGAEILVQAYSIERNDFRDISTKMKSFQPDLLILSGFQTHLVTLIRSLRNFQLIQAGNTIATYDLLDAAPLLRPQELEGIRVSIPSFLVEEGQTPYNQWKDRFKAQFGKDPLYTTAYAYDLAQILLDVARRRISEPRKTIAQLIRQTNISGITGRLIFLDSGDLDIDIELGIFSDGALTKSNGEMSGAF